MGKVIHVAALDLGSSKIVGMVARKNEDGALTILASEQIKSDNCIRRGTIYNREETKKRVSDLIIRLNRKLESPIEKVCIGIGGQSVHTEPYSIKKPVPDGVVTAELLEEIENEAWDFQVDSLETFDVVSPEYYLDGTLEKNPKGAMCSDIEARFNIVVGRSTLKKNLVSTILNANLNNAGFFISPLATAASVLNEKEKALGCALVEFGAGITYVSVYHDGLLRYLATIPLGGDTITKDIHSLIKLGAEEAKIQFAERDEDEQLIEVIDARRDEILENVIHQIKASGYESKLGAGIIVTGGAAQLRNLPEKLKEKAGKEVRLAQDPANSCVLGMLTLADEECLKKKEVPAGDLFGPEPTPQVKEPKKEEKKEKDKEKEDKPKKKGNKLKTFIDNMSTSLFGEDDFK